MSHLLGYIVSTRAYSSPTPKVLPHLPDLPTAGYGTRLEKATTDAIMFFLRAAERDRLLLLSIVIEGRVKWRQTAGRVWRGLAIDTDLLDSVYAYLVLLAGRNPVQQRDALRALRG